MLTLFASFALSVYFQPHEEKSFLSWMRSSNNFYTGDEYQLRFGIWLSNSRLVQEHNKEHDFQLEMNKFASYTPAEYSALLGFKPQARFADNAVMSKFVADDELDYRLKGVVNEVKDQGSCGSCWAFSTIQAVESAYALKTGKLLSLSEQNLVDCATECNGCNGGLMDAALNYVINNQGGKFNTESDYPYKGSTRHKKCKFDSKKAVASVSKYINVVYGNEDDLQAKISQYGPAAIAIDASHYSFQLYSKGIYDEKRCSTSNLDHAVGCVGYGSEKGKDYWIVRNSWGDSWGEKGYIRMIKGKNNKCGIASMALVVIP